MVLAVEVLLRDAVLPEGSNGDYITMSVGVEWLLTAFFAAYWIPRVEGLGRASVGLVGIRGRDLWLGTAVFVAQLVLTTLAGGALKAMGLGTLQDLQPMLGGYGVLTLAALFSAGFLEELFYRGYLIERLTAVTGRLWVGALASWLCFTLVHFGFFGLGATLQVSILSASLVLVYARERSIWPCMVIHGINSLFAYVLFPAFG